MARVLSQAGIGEIFLATTNSFEKSNPAEYGFDAVVDFTPNSAGLSPTRDLIENLPPSFEGGLFNYDNLVAQSDNYRVEDFTIFRGASPSWDNTARKKNKGYIFLNSSPVKYQKWLNNSIKYMTECKSAPNDSLVFINAWNEWAEGAHLEPDQNTATHTSRLPNFLSLSRLLLICQRSKATKNRLRSLFMHST